MSIWAIIPVKPLSRAKSRLQSILSQPEREKLAEQMLIHVLRVVKAAPEVHGVLVITRDTRALALARDLGAQTVVESGTPELNNALMRATQVVTAWRGSAVLILPADLPLIETRDVSAICALGEESDGIVIATDQDDDGTNALLVRPPGLIPYTYGVGSFTRHIEMAKAAGAAVKVYHSERLMLDIDIPADLERYQRLISGESEKYCDHSRR